MFSIKQSYADCSSCDLLRSNSCLLETNCQEDLSQVDIVFVAENPGKDEIKNEVPLIGRAGQTFRKYFNKFKLNEENYLLTNCVLCQTLDEDGNTGNPENHVIERCKVNCMNIIRLCNPKLVVLMGASPMSAFGFGKSGITKIHGNLTKWEKFQTMIIVHPSFVNRNRKEWEPKFEQGMANIAEKLTGEKFQVSAGNPINKMGEGIFRYKIPERFYTDDYRLIDVQYLHRSSQVLYIFRDKENNKIYHKESDLYVCYKPKPGVEARKIVPYEDLQQISIKYKDKDMLDSDKTYEGDVRITTKHAQDYYHFNKGEPNLKQNVMFFDIEIDTGKDKVFPLPQEAAYPINLLTTIYNGKTTCYVIDNKTEPIIKEEGIQYNVHSTEKNMIQQFMRDFKKSDPDFLAGWNCINFDLDYIFNRLPKLGIKPETLSNHGEFYVDGPNYRCHLAGCVALDQEFLYRTFTFTKMENYKLGFIAEHEVKETKIPLPLPFNEMYWKMLNKTIEYNIRDTVLLEKLENKLKHINLLNELRIICQTSFEATSSFGEIDSIVVAFLKNKGLSPKNHDPHIVKTKYPGGFVFEPEPNLYEYLTDFDFASLYPSLIITYNIGVNNFVMKTEDPKLGYELAYCPDKLPDKIAIIYDPLYSAKRMVVEKDKLLAKVKESKLVHTINGCFFKPHEKQISSLAEVVDMIMTSRKEYKGKMFEAIEKKDKEGENFYYTRQLVYKVLANTLYGVIANKAFRFFDLSLATAITFSGQEALKTSIIYGDALMKSVVGGEKYKNPKPLTKEEVFSEEMPNRSNRYIVTGDTDSIFCCFKELPEEKRTVETIRGYCEEIEKFLNKDKIIELVQKHQVDVNYNRLELKNELFIPKGLFLAKKRYVIRVTNQEGKEVDKMNYMGVEIKRSDYPRMSKELLTELTDLLLKSDKFSLSKILDYTSRKEREILEAIVNREKRASRPVSWGKRLEDYKSIPQGVRAMQAWNDIMYPIHKHGTKAYLYWVNGIDLDKAPKEVAKKYHEFIKKGNKFDVIAIPDEEEKLPDFFIIDKKAALKFVFDSRQKLFLKPLMKSNVGMVADGVLTF